MNKINLSNYPLNKICYFQEGPGLRKWQYKSEGIKFINIRCLKDGKINLNKAQHISSEEVNKKYKHFLLKEDDYVISSSGTIGRVSKVNRCNMPLMLNTSIIRFRTLDEKILDNGYLKYILESNYFIKKIKKHSQGSAQINFGPSHLNQLNIDLPEIKTQKKIKTILENLDKIINENIFLLDKFQFFKYATINQLMSSGIKHKNFKKSEIGIIPEIWNCLKIEQIVFDKKKSIKIGPFGSALSKKEMIKSGYKVYGQENIFKNNFNIGKYFISKKKYEKLKSCNLSPGDVVISMMGTIGNASVVPSNIEEGIMDSHLMKITVDRKKISPYFLVLLFSEYELIKKQILKMSQGGIMSGLNSSIIKNLMIPVPKIEEQEKIVSQIKEINKFINFKLNKIKKLKFLKKSIIKDYIPGKKD